ncbi:hypothetical protein IWZ03DRAFT_375722 [Phyllosticta citriasiana]|uniref:Uncharacterized protein n=1 Tax=Phyllosticta citriasiana TaxID=595635 RepID=A0ABR1KV77_9PEZI
MDGSHAVRPPSVTAAAALIGRVHPTTGGTFTPSGHRVWLTSAVGAVQRGNGKRHHQGHDSGSTMDLSVESQLGSTRCAVIRVHTTQAGREHVIACLLLRSDPCVPARRNRKKKKKKKETTTCHPPCSSHESGRTMCLTDSVSSESAQRLPNEVAAEKQARESETEGKQKPTRFHCITHPTTLVPHPGRPSEGGQGIVIQHVQMSRASKMRAKKNKFTGRARPHRTHATHNTALSALFVWDPRLGEVGYRALFFFFFFFLPFNNHRPSQGSTGLPACLVGTSASTYVRRTHPRTPTSR